MKNGKIFILSGPSGAGKTTLYQKLLSNPRLKKRLVKTVSVTTRSKRKGEQNGRDYWFVSEKMFLYKKRQGHFLESEEVFDRHYGTPYKQVKDFLKSGKNVLLCIDVKGAKTVWKKFPEAVRVFVKTPSMDVLALRLRSRASEDDKTVSLRLKTAKEELKEAKNYGHVIVNDNLTTAYEHILQIVCSELGDK